MPITLAWVGDPAPRMEVAHVERRGRGLTAMGTQLGAGYELRYRLERDRLHLELVGQQSLEVPLGDADFFDLAWSPLFNSLPVMRERLLEGGPARDYVMRRVDVPSLEVTTSEQRYEPLGGGLIRFSAGDFAADIQFDQQGFVVGYPGLARRAEDPVRARSILEDEARARPGSASIWYSLARLEAHEGRGEAALAAARKALESVGADQRDELRSEMLNHPALAEIRHEL